MGFFRDSLSEDQRRLLQLLEEPLPLIAEPFAYLAAQCGMAEGEALAFIEDLKHAGVIRRFGARIRHHQVGYSANGMSVWAVADDEIDEVGALMAVQPEISHCYQRAAFDGWPYNLYAMIHGSTKDEIDAVAWRVARETGIEDYDILFSVREFKKSTPCYFGEADASRE